MYGVLLYFLVVSTLAACTRIPTVSAWPAARQIEVTATLGGILTLLRTLMPSVLKSDALKKVDAADNIYQFFGL